MKQSPARSVCLVCTSSLPDLLSKEECLELQDDEIGMLEAMFPEELSITADDRRSFRVRLRLLSKGDAASADYASLLFCLPADYPTVIPVFELETGEYHKLSVADADFVYDQLLATAMSHIGSAMVYDLVIQASELAESVIVRQQKAAAEAEEEKELKSYPEYMSGLHGDIFQLPSEDNSAEESNESGDDDYSNTHASASATTSEASSRLPRVIPNRGKMSRHLLHNSCDMYNPGHFIGSLRDIIAMMPKGLKILKIENILNERLALRFQERWDSMSLQYWRQVRRDVKNYHSEPVVAFHGTMQRNLPSIVQRGLVVPGTKSGVQVAHGSAYGVGIYTSPSIETALNYNAGDQVLVCAVLLGHVCNMSYGVARKANWIEGKKFDSVISPCGYQYVVPLASQVLPCYVIDVKWFGRPSMLSPPPTPVPVPVKLTVQPVEMRERRQQQLLARAKKFLPYGFGPMGKHGLVVEAAASLDDDEEAEYSYWEKNDDEAATEKVKVVRSNLQSYRYKDDY